MNNKQSILIKILFFIRYFGDSLFYSFIQIYLAYKGLSEGQIGLVTSITPIVGLLINPFWNTLSKDVNSNRKIMKIITILEGILFIGFIPFTKLELLCVITCLIAIVGSPFYSLLDGYTSTFSEQNNKNYASYRMMGSIAYMIGVTVGGLLIEYSSYQITICIAGIIFIFLSILIHFFKPMYVKDDKEEIIKRDYKAILKNKKFFVYTLLYLFTVTISIQGDNFINLYLTNVCNLNASKLGYVSSIIILVEVVTMVIVSKFFSKAKESKLLVIAGFIYAVRSLLLGFNLPIPVSICIVMLRGLSWGIILSVHIKYVTKIVGLENTTAAIFIISIFTSIFTFFGSNVYGNIIEHLGYNVAYMSIGIICGIASIFFVIFAIMEKKMNNKKYSS